MALQHFLCGLTVVINLSSKGCHSQSVCGSAKKNTRIIGGQDASPGSWPWQVSLHDKNGAFFCGGSLISNQWVMTAAHCVSNPNSKIMVHLGGYSQSSPNSNEVSGTVVNATCHPAYSFMTNNNDICLLKLSAPVLLTDFVFPVCLASESSTFHTDVSTWVTGWGQTSNDTSSDILQEVNVPIVGNNECRCNYGNRLTDNMICAGLRAGGKDSCRGDSGGAMVAKKDSSWFQIGIVSFGDGCAEPMIPGVYTRVSQYQNWIKSVTGSSQPGFVTFISSGVDSDVNFTCPTAPPETTAKTITTTTTATTTANTTTTATTATTTANTTTTTADTTINGTHLPPPSGPVTDKGFESVFDSGENVIYFSHSTHFISLCILVHSRSLCAAW